MIHQITRAELIVIAARLKQAQDMIGYSDERMASMFDISTVQYSKILRGHSMITEDKLIILKQEMNISLDYLITGQRAGRNVLISNQSMTEVEFRMYMEEISYYIENLPVELKKDRMMEMMRRFYKTFSTL